MVTVPTVTAKAAIPATIAQTRRMVTGEARLAAEVFAIAGLLGVIYAGALRRLSSLGLGRGDHESNQGIPHGLLDGILGGAIEGHAVDDGLDDDFLPSEPCSRREGTGPFPSSLVPFEI